MKSIELFAGIGGIALAAEWAGIETVAFCERDPFCKKVLNKHWPSIPIFDDVCTLNKKMLQERGVDVGAIELISGGFPCQPYSIAGKRKGTEDDRDLWPEMFRLIEEIRPTWVVGENVANFANMELDRTLSDLESIGYKGQSFVIPACAVNAKHERKRTFIVANSYSNLRRRKKRTGPRYVEKAIRQDIKGKRNQEWNAFECSSKDVPYTDSERLEGSYGEKLESQYLARCSEKGTTWAVEPNVGRVADGVRNRVDRLRGLGNAVVPQQIYPIFHYIKMINDKETQE
jgi:DNA (cytosine-5)-methyltransferase 1